jgi:hypothetical protein
MSTHVWTPGAAGPLDEFVGRLGRMIAAFAVEHELDAAEVRIELADGSRHVVSSMQAEPGFGFFSFVPHTEDDEPRRLVVPVGVVKLVEISHPDPARSFGFTATG